MSSVGDLSARGHDTKAYQDLGANVAKAVAGAGEPHTIACNGISRIGDRSKGRQRYSGAQGDRRHLARVWRWQKMSDDSKVGVPWC